MANPYEDSQNFNHRLKVETNMQGEIIDHREGFAQREYFRNMQDQPQANEGGGFPPMKSVTQPPKPKGGVKKVSRKKTQQDEAIDKAVEKDLKSRNLKP